MLGTLGHPQGLGHSLRYQYFLREGSEPHQPHPIRVGLDEVAGYLQSEARLARATYASEGQEARRGQLKFDLEHLPLTTYEAAPLGGQVVPRGAGRLVCSTDAQGVSHLVVRPLTSRGVGDLTWFLLGG